MSTFNLNNSTFNIKEIKVSAEDKALVGRLFAVSSKEYPTIDITVMFDGVESVAITKAPDMTRRGDNVIEAAKNLLTCLI